MGRRYIATRRPMYFAAGSSAFTPILDSLATPKYAYSVGRRLRTAYTGPIIRVRRSTDSAEQDFYGTDTADGGVNVASVVSFCGAGDGQITTMYDQSGNGYHLTQATATRQPYCVASGVAYTKNSHLSAFYIGANASSLNRGALEAYFKFLHDGTTTTHYIVTDTVDDAGIKILFGTLNAATDVGTQFYFSASEGLIIITRGTSPEIPINVSKTPAPRTFHTYTSILDPDNGTAANRETTYYDGTAMSTSNAATGVVSSANPSRPFIIGANSSGSTSNAYEGHVCELVTWDSDLSASRSIWESSCRSFWGTP